MIEGERVELNDWWGCRDHSWGVRPGVGGWNPVTSTPQPVSQAGSLFAFLFFSTDQIAGHLQIAERGEQRNYLTGLVRRFDDPHHDLHIASSGLRLTFFDGTRRVQRANFAATLDDGRSLEIEANALGPSIAMPGLGYSGGWNDKLSLGAFRGEAYREVDIWDVSNPVDVIWQDGSVDKPLHRIQPVTMKVTSGDAAFPASKGTGSLTLIANGRLPQYNLT